MKQTLTKPMKKIYGIASLYLQETTNSSAGTCSNRGSGICNNSGSGTCNNSGTGRCN